MLMLLFRVGEEPWAIAVAEVCEVVPLVALQAMSQGWSDGVSHSAAWRAGLMNYRGATIPVVDVSALLSGQAAEQTLNTRIVVVEAGERVDESVGQSRREVGLVLPNVSETTSLEAVNNIPTVSRYVHSTWQQPAFANVIYRLAIDPIVQQVYQTAAAPMASPNHRQSALTGVVSQTNSFSRKGV